MIGEKNGENTELHIWVDKYIGTLKQSKLSS